MSVNLRQGSCSYRVVYQCQCVIVCMNGWVTDCSVKHFGVLGLDRVLSADHLPFLPKVYCTLSKNCKYKINIKQLITTKTKQFKILLTITCTFCHYCAVFVLLFRDLMESGTNQFL
ncbi:hypothetical protein ATANTOWER_022452 [Ataeniobius toweri]|uniref:Uncharacterized protein n=1 Tax=Ataeniobius toweri TaxID=208326 RepID=A0ABU7AZZ2_9TELE|nr:hypothetical protein [Ataeniobius toweri]